jgi:hypothetical protein
MFTAALFIIAKLWKQPRCPIADEWIKKIWYYLPLKKLKVLSPTRQYEIELK